MKGRLILNSRMLGGGIAGSNLSEEFPSKIQIDRRRESKLE
jgi:hypothetical protein